VSGRIRPPQSKQYGDQMKTYSAKANEINNDWVLIDAKGLTLGRMAAEIASRLRGKHKPEFTAHIDTGDHVIVINAESVHVTGNKSKNKTYYSHSGFPGGLKELSFEKLIARVPERAVQLAVKGMLPKTALGRAMFKKLKVYAGPEHPHAAQQPQPIEI